MFQMQQSIISIINQKGGCAKSSTCFHMAGHFAKSGFRVLLIDADPQGSLSQAFFGPAAVESTPKEATLAAAFDSEVFVDSIDDLAMKTAFEGIEIVPANLHLAKFNVPEPLETGMRQFALSTLVESANSFDIVLIDCPPNLYQCSWNALLASDFVAIPLNADDFGVQGFRAVQQAIESAQQFNPELKLLGQFLTKFDRRVGIHREFETTLRRVYGNQVFATVIQEASAFKMAVAARKPVAYYSSWSRATRQTKHLAIEFLERISQHTTNQKAA